MEVEIVAECGIVPDVAAADAGCGEHAGSVLPARQKDIND
jgi:hypothetical protein